MPLETISPQRQLAHHVKQRRHFQRLSQTDLAIRAGVSRQTVTRIEAGTANPSLGLLIRLSEALSADLMISLRRQVPATLSATQSGPSAQQLSPAASPDL